MRNGEGVSLEEEVAVGWRSGEPAGARVETSRAGQAVTSLSARSGDVGGASAARRRQGRGEDYPVANGEVIMATEHAGTLAGTTLRS